MQSSLGPGFAQLALTLIEITQLAAKAQSTSPIRPTFVRDSPGKRSSVAVLEGVLRKLGNNCSVV